MSYGGVSGGMMQGAQTLQSIQQRAQQIQQAQQQIDQQKRELAAQASLFQNLPQQAQPQGNAQPGMAPMGQPPQGAMPQPPMPGQSSSPMQPPGGPAPGATTPAGFPQGGPPPGGPPPGGQQMPGQNPGAGGQDLSPQAQMQLLTQIAQSIKQRSPGMDPLTLFEAVKQQIGLMTALSNTQKQQLVYAVDQFKAQNSQQIAANHDAQSGANTVTRVEGQKDIADKHDQTSRDNTKAKIAAALQQTQARIADADSRLKQTQDAIGARQDKSLQGRATQKVQTERLGLLRTQLAQAKQKLSQAAASADSTAIAAAQQQVNSALQNIATFQQKVIGQGGAPGGQASPPDAGGAGQAGGPTATDAKGNKVQWNGTAWVPASGQ